MQNLNEFLGSCALCPRKCAVDRKAGERGFCGIGEKIVLSHALPYHGEEPPISGSRGAGTIFFSSCTLKCIYCQNYQISHQATSRQITVAELSEIMLDLQRKGCHNVELVTPTHQLPPVIEALIGARGEGLTIPVVYNCGGYENAEIIHLLSGLVDIYLPDFKYGTDAASLKFSGVDDYAEHALASIREMIEQAGEELEMEDGIAHRGILIRHLVLPGMMDDSLSVLGIIRKNFSPAVTLSLMAQYTPVPAVHSHPDLNRRITRQEYETVVDAALEMGFDHLYVQEVDDRSLFPDFMKDNPFDWWEHD